VVEPGTEPLRRIAEHFGSKILLANGSLDRARLRGIIFAEAEQRRWLESVTVPAIMQLLEATLRHSTSPYSILMLSSGRGQHPLIDRHLVVDVTQQTQLARVMARDQNDLAQVQAIMATQPSRETRLDYADDVIKNEGSLADLYDAVAALHIKYLELSGESYGHP